MDLVTILPTHFIPYGCKRLKVSQIDEGVGVIVFILKLSELGSDHSQDDAVCRRRLFIFPTRVTSVNSVAALKLIFGRGWILSVLCVLIRSGD